MRLWICLLSAGLAGSVALFNPAAGQGADYIRDLQLQAIAEGSSPLGHWGNNPGNYMAWGSHTSRLIPVYTFGTKGAGKGIDLDSYTGANSAYRSKAALKQIYGRIPTNTLNPTAEYLDQTNVAAIQRAALAAGKKHIILVVFDGMDWDTTRSAAIFNEKKISYTSGRGTGTHFQNYTAKGTTQFGYMVTSPNNTGTKFDINTQQVLNPGGTQPGGYNVEKAGPNPWTPGNDIWYPIGKSGGESKPGEHAYPDSAGTAAAMMSGIKTYNGAINVDVTGGQISTVAYEAQQQGYLAGAVSSVPTSHATPACAYAHNVSRNDYQDISRDQLGLPSISHPKEPLPGLDVLIGGGFGAMRKKDSGGQGKNFVPGNTYLTAEDLDRVNVKNGGKYVVAVRTPGVNGGEQLQAAAQEAVKSNQRLLGFYGVGKVQGHLPFATADGDFDPVPGRTKKKEEYTPADITENPTLAQMATAALTVLNRNPKGFWLMVEAGEVDWANHDNNIDNSIGAVNSGAAAVKAITDWVEQNSNWDETVMIVTADHGHYLILEKPELLAGEAKETPAKTTSAK